MAERKSTKIVIVISLVLMFAQCWSAEAEKDRVQELEGYMNFTGKFEMFSGYL